MKFSSKRNYISIQSILSTRISSININYCFSTNIVGVCAMHKIKIIQVMLIPGFIK